MYLRLIDCACPYYNTEGVEVMFCDDLRCIRCGKQPEQNWAYEECPYCLKEGISSNYSAQLNLSGFPLTRSLVEEGQPGIWKYRYMYAIDKDMEPISLIEGNTPLVHLKKLGEKIGLKKLYAKDESRNPTWSHKDRLSSVGVTKAKEVGADCIVLSSTGNQGISAAAYAAKAGIKCVVFTANSSPQVMKTLMQSYGAMVFQIPTGEERAKLVGDCARELGWFPLTDFGTMDKGANPYAIDGYKSMAVEILQDLGDVPDKIIFPVAGGDSLFGTWKGFSDLMNMKRINKLPKMIAVEPFGPLTKSVEENSKIPLEVEEGKTVAFSVATTSCTYQALKTLYDSHGYGVVVKDPAMMQAQQKLAASEGIFVEPASAMSVAAVEILSLKGEIKPDEKVVAVLTSTGLKEPESATEYLPKLQSVEPTLESLKKSLKESYNFII